MLVALMSCHSHNESGEDKNNEMIGINYYQVMQAIKHIHTYIHTYIYTYIVYTRRKNNRVSERNKPVPNLNKPVPQW